VRDAHDVGDGGFPVTPIRDRGGHRVDQPLTMTSPLIAGLVTGPLIAGQRFSGSRGHALTVASGSVYG
jgi:hypothetical protein